jgi:hypothetical protein
MPDRIGSGAENVQSFLQPNNPGHTYAFQMNQPWKQEFRKVILIHDLTCQQ